ncbi:Hpt domain-containing protein [Thiomicrospira microaerophila]|uniref:Hpt domain-containing protein n=1 Tax=Thiomicrospira microaerophila TaxID=406020 RepID=UPI00200ED8E2|nr:Hpt domain-containing protein [Thiomicrospira microaerophila]UQB42385.1 Hpt domain-containing protein [Thiomicrospira microaerophila]
MSQILDYDNLNMLKEVIGDDLKAILESFNDITPQVIEQLDQAIQQQNATEVRHQAHTLKGSAANVGAIELPALCFELENMGRTGELAGAEALFTQINASYSRLSAAVNEYINTEL